MKAALVSHGKANMAELNDEVSDGVKSMVANTRMLP